MTGSKREQRWVLGVSRSEARKVIRRRERAGFDAKSSIQHCYYCPSVPAALNLPSRQRVNIREAYDNVMHGALEFFVSSWWYEGQPLMKTGVRGLWLAETLFSTQNANSVSTIRQRASTSCIILQALSRAALTVLDNASNIETYNRN